MVNTTVSLRKMCCQLTQALGKLFNTNIHTDIVKWWERMLCCQAASVLDHPKLLVSWKTPSYRNQCFIKNTRSKKGSYQRLIHTKKKHNGIPSWIKTKEFILPAQQARPPFRRLRTVATRIHALHVRPNFACPL